MTPHPPRRIGFTLVELLVVLFVVVLLIAILLPTLCRSSEQGNRIKCASNLRQIGMAIMMYSGENKGNFPRTIFDEAAWPVPAFFTNPVAPHPFKPGGPVPNDVTAALFLVLRTQDLTSEMFLCPSGEGERPTQNPQTISNFPSPANLAYSYNNPYPSKAAIDQRFRFNTTLPSEYAMAADINPGGAVLLDTRHDAPRVRMSRLNSPNHAGDGQNVLYGDGHAEFQTSPFCGMPREAGEGVAVRDNIYASGGPGAGAPPVVEGAVADRLDSVPLPVARSGPVAPATARVMGVRLVVWMATAGVAVVALSLLVAAVVRGRHGLRAAWFRARAPRPA